MPEIDKVGVAWGVLFSVIVNGLYNALLLFFHADWQGGVLVCIVTFIVIGIVLIAFRNLLFNQKNKQKKNEEIDKDKMYSGRDLDIKLAQLNSKLQIEIAAFFGFVALSLGSVIAAYQFGLPSLGTLSWATLGAMTFIAVAFVAVISATYYLIQLRSTERDFKNLR